MLAENYYRQINNSAFKSVLDLDDNSKVQIFFPILYIR